MSRKKIKDNQYICLSAILRAKEAKMLTRAQMERMLTETSFPDVCRIASECGYADMSGMDVAGINATLAEARARQLSEISELIPDAAVLDLFRMKYGYHNAKIVVKSRGDIDAHRDLISEARRFSVEELLEVYRSESENGALPKVYADAIREAKSALARTGNPQLSDYILDKAYFAEQLREAEKYSKPYITDYVRLQIDKANLCSLMRTMDMDKRADALQYALIEGGNISLDEISAVETREDLTQLFAKTIFAKAAAAEGMTEMEKAADNAIREYVLRVNYVPFGPEVVIEYVSALENEIMSLRIILTGKLMDIPVEKLRERLRESYV
ncbi:MAG: hypothetical protein E7472_02945 [Ruminococcaceae bacterium]|nr:hypothetical protein [Oscillospiraceae bacterium]